ncbi:flagellar protein FlhE [Enterobacter cloacae]|jgi:flagellar protein FlhE|uniref:flagellar protein FlhE n=1 Tax=Enterobacter cloacae TaxID=550 RepID=UPI000E4F353F|nr:flagellar protein FlhE [Enterobacter cloacae]MBF4109647.1 flagellar protein FlhE [Enterobacter cloacae]MCU6228426.1 flagellar protein FlhE [Enterobacter cloacae]MDT8891887.1 flagellar protein FlhE [Enterobacter cloacae]RHI06441.1 flagellar protein FlhE [Enterobacter cloacae]
MRRAGLALLLVSPLAMAADGSWSASSFGGTMTRGQVVLKSKPVQSPSPLPAGAVASRVHWKIQTSGLTPAGFRIRLCSATRCLTLPGFAGELPLPAGMPAGGPFRFEYYSVAGGRLDTPLTVLKNQVTVSYRNRG